MTHTDGLEVDVRLAPQTVTDSKYFDLITSAWIKILEQDAWLRYLARLEIACQK